MGSLRLSCSVRFVLVWALGLAGCDGGQSRQDAPDTPYVSIGARERGLVDDYALLDKKALQGIKKTAADAALAGDGSKALVIGNEFAQANRLSEARFWLQISAENGNGIGMQRYSLLIREFDCRRANYWLQRALSSGHIRGEAQVANGEDLKNYKKACGTD